MPDQQDGGSSDSPQAVVAVFGSAARTESLKRLLTTYELPAGAALVVILQHREALDEEGLQAALADAGRQLTPIEDHAAVEPGRIYLPAANLVVTLEGDRFRTWPSQQRPGERGTIDTFLVSLAQEQDGRSIAVALAGTGGDGTLGLREIKAADGLAIAEESQEAAEGHLASSQSPAALADDVLPLDALIERLTALVNQLLTQNGAAGERASDISAALASIATVLRKKTGHDFHGYKQGTFLRRVRRRMQATGTDDLKTYVELIRNAPDEALQLFNDLLIGVTQFFRDPKEFELLESEVIPKLFEQKGSESALRVWVVGCSTGEEAYSIAILLREYMEQLDEVPHVQIFATDLDGRALAAARSGRYTADIADRMSPQRLARWFVKEGTTYCVAKELREMCIFSQHSIVKDAPFSRLDLVSCRNLLIYLDSELQDRVIPLFHFALGPGGYLFLGNAENVSRHASLFQPIEARSRIYRRLETGRRTLPEFPFTAVDRRVQLPTAPERPRNVEVNLALRAERFAERFAPAYVIIDRAHTILHFSGRTGRYIDPAGGTASLNLLQLAHPDLRAELRAALAQAAEATGTVHVNDIQLGVNGSQISVDLVVEPVHESGSAPIFFVLFKDSATNPRHNDESRGRDAHEKLLEAELRTTRDRLQATVEELESTNEELKSSNEEYQSLNEELQSANEELETSKEELQSVNEELTTVNGELAHRVQELTRATSDLKNFLESTQIATIFLDNDLKITNFTPAVAELFHLIETDVGRPIAHIRPRVAYDQLQDDARRMLRTLSPVEREIVNEASGTQYIVRVLPYRSIDNYIAGVVVTFVDITERHRAEEARRESEERYRAIVESARDYAIFSTDLDGRVVEWPAGAAAIFGWSAEEIVGRDAGVLYTPEDRADGVWERERATARETGFAPNVRWHLRKDGRRVFIEGSAQTLRDGGGQVRGLIKIGQDVTERRRREEALRESERQSKTLLAELQHRVRNTLAVIRSIVRRTSENASSVDEMTMDLQGRIDAFARVQAVVTRNPLAGIDLSSLVAEELRAARAREDDNLVIEGEPLRLEAKAAQTFGLAIHELTTNALKHGALCTAGGRIHVRWHRDTAGGEPVLVFTWIENGLSGVPEKPQRRGFGMEILEKTLAYELKASTDIAFEPTGLRCRITLPLERLLMKEEAAA